MVGLTQTTIKMGVQPAKNGYLMDKKWDVENTANDNEDSTKNS